MWMIYELSQLLKGLDKVYRSIIKSSELNMVQKESRSLLLISLNLHKTLTEPSED